jgi:DNA-binding NarL/FixJ family response regulator
VGLEPRATTSRSWGASRDERLEALDHLRRDHPAIPVVIVTGNTDEPLAERTLGSGAAAYVVRPFTVDALSEPVTPRSVRRSKTRSRGGT